MHYFSTRGQDGPLGYEDALLSGLARDGGLYLPETWPKFSREDIAAMQGLSYAELAGRIMAPFCVGEVDEKIMSYLYDDLNTPKALARIHYLADQANKGSKECAQLLKNSNKILGILSYSSEDWFKFRNNSYNHEGLDNDLTEEEINNLILERQNAKKEKDFKKADKIRDNLLNFKIVLEDQPDKTIWRRV